MTCCFSDNLHGVIKDIEKPNITNEPNGQNMIVEIGNYNLCLREINIRIIIVCRKYESIINVTFVEYIRREIWANQSNITPICLLNCLYKAWKVSGHVFVC